MLSEGKPDFFLQSGSKVDLHVGWYFKTPKSRTEFVYSSELVELWHKLFMIHRRKKFLLSLRQKQVVQTKDLINKDDNWPLRIFSSPYAIIPLWRACSKINFSLSPCSDRYCTICSENFCYILRSRKPVDSFAWTINFVFSRFS